MKNVIFRDLGSMQYKEAWDLQEQLFEDLISIKKDESKADFAGHLLFVEHPHVFTIGKNGNDNNMLVNEDFLKSKGASYYHINRGGDITYHGPGQIVGYPILDLDKIGIGIREYVFRIEECVIQCLQNYNISAERSQGASGVWIDTDKPDKIRKICAIGVRASRSVTMHGFAFNINTDLNYYSFINPCGFADRGVTSLKQELGREVDFLEAKMFLEKSFSEVFGVVLHESNPAF